MNRPPIKQFEVETPKGMTTLYVDMSQPNGNVVILWDGEYIEMTQQVARALADELTEHTISPA